MSSPDHVHFVFSLPPEHVSQETYDEFYEQHVSEILECEGFAGARRYWLVPGSSERPTVEFRHLVIYRIDGPPEAAHAAVGQRYAAGEMTSPEWFGGVSWLTYDGRPLNDDDLVYPDEAYVEFSHAPNSLTSDDFNGWYDGHARQKLTTDGLETVWRCALTPGAMTTVEDPIAARATHAALYESNGALGDLRAALTASADAGRLEIPAWMPEAEVFSYYGRAAAPAR